MRRAFTLIEVLISVLILSLALLGLAAVFVATTKVFVINRQAVLAATAIKSGESIFRGLHPVNPKFPNGWTVETVNDIDTRFLPKDDIPVLAFTHGREYQWPITIVVAFYKDLPEYGFIMTPEYLPVNGDVLFSWYGERHDVKNGIITPSIQPHEQEYEMLLLHRSSKKILDWNKIGMVDWPP